MVENTKGLSVEKRKAILEEMVNGEALKKDMYEVVYNKSLGTFEFYGSETEPLSHIIRKGSVVKNNSAQKIAIYNSDKSIFEFVGRGRFHQLLHCSHSQQLSLFHNADAVRQGLGFFHIVGREDDGHLAF